MTSFPSPICSRSALSPRSTARFFSSMICTERPCMVSTICFILWTRSMGIAETIMRRSHAGPMRQRRMITTRRTASRLSAPLRKSIQHECESYERMCLQKLLDRLPEIIRYVLHERIKRVAESALSDELKRGPTHPLQDVDFCGVSTELAQDSTTQLRMSSEHDKVDLLNERARTLCDVS